MHCDKIYTENSINLNIAVLSPFASNNKKQLPAEIDHQMHKRTQSLQEIEVIHKIKFKNWPNA